MILITGDVHCPHDILKLKPENFPDGHLTKNDYLIVCGDMGIVWDGSKHDEYWKEWFEQRNYTTLFVDGNHENHPLLNEYPVVGWHGGKVHQIMPSVLHLMRGQIFDIEGSSFLALGGAKSHDIEYRIEGLSWWREEVFSQDDYIEAIRNLRKRDFLVDYVISHDCPSHVLPAIGSYLERNEHTDMLEKIYQQIGYTRWYFGHHHVNMTLPENMRCLYEDIIEVK